MAPKRAREGSTVEDAEEFGIAPLKEEQRKPGSIVRLLMQNFLTYDHAEMFATPGLNTVIGPNGTGKSSVVAAIILVLGGLPSSIARADNVKDFVKMDSDKDSTCFIEIELWKGGDKGENVIIQRTITRDNKSDWFMNKKKVTQKQVVDLTHRLHIQVNNLCVVLAQDRVCKFAQLTPAELLLETEKASESTIHDMHMELVELRKNERNVHQKVTSGEEQLARLKEEFAGLEEEVKLQEQRQECEKKIDLLGKKLLWANYSKKKEETKVLKQQRDALDEEIKKLDAENKPQQERVDAFLKAYNSWTAKELAGKEQMKKLQGQRKAVIDNMSVSEEKIDEAQDDLKHLHKNVADKKKELAKLQDVIVKTKKEIREFQGMTEAEVKKLLGENMTKISAVKEKLHTNNQRAQQLSMINERSKRKVMEKETAMKSGLLAREKRIREASQNNADIGKTANWLDNNRDKFKGRIFGPLFLEVDFNTNNPWAAAYVEKHLPYDRAISYIVEKEEDFELMSVQIRDKMHLRLALTCLPNKPQEEPRRKQEFNANQKKAGVEGWLDELIECNPIVRTFLNREFQLLNCAYSFKQGVNIDALMMKKANDGGLQSLFIPQSYSRSAQSRFGNNCTGFVDRVYEHAQLFKKMEKQDNTQLQAEVEVLKQEILANTKELQALKDEEKVLNKEQKELNDEKNRIREDGMALKRMENQLRRYEAEFQEKNEEDSDVATQEANFKKVIVLFANKRYQRMKELTELTTGYLNSMLEVDGVGVSRLFSKANHTKATTEMEHAMNELKKKKLLLMAAQKAYKDQDAEASAAKEVAHAEAPLAQYSALFQEPGMPDDIEEIETLISTLEVQANAGLHDASIIARHQALKVEIAETEYQLANKDKIHQSLDGQIKEKERVWREQLDKIVVKIDKQFQKYYAHIKCQGAVKLKESHDFEQYELEIMVSYREDQPLKRLSASVQSGGERSVATMLYLLCLQQVTESPFRIVDEINQGMDPKNERMIFDQFGRLVNAAGDGSCKVTQYFFVTPKLLPNLPFDYNISVHTVFNGMWMGTGAKWKLDEIMNAQEKLKLKKSKR